MDVSRAFRAIKHAIRYLGAIFLIEVSFGGFETGRAFRFRASDSQISLTPHTAPLISLPGL
jgi:hypothetical protein